jgi:hypothetical protein
MAILQGHYLLPCQEIDGMREHSSTLLLFGATGDLSRRMLLPSRLCGFFALREVR